MAVPVEKIKNPLNFFRVGDVTISADGQLSGSKAGNFFHRTASAADVQKAYREAIAWAREATHFCGWGIFYVVVAEDGKSSEWYCLMPTHLERTTIVELHLLLGKLPRRHEKAFAKATLLGADSLH